MSWTKEQMVQQAAAELRDGMVVNLGIGMPTLVANQVPPGLRVTFQSENGLLGMGPFPHDDEVDPQIINAGKQTVTIVPGGSVFDSAQSFAMLRGGHIDLAILGGLEVNMRGDLANWAVPGKMVTGMGGAMDLAAGARRLIVLQTHTAKDGQSKLRRELTLPVTALGCVSRVITELGVFSPTGSGFHCLGKPDDVTAETIRASTDAPVTFE